MLVSTTYENEDAKRVHTDVKVLIKLETAGSVRAFVDELLSLFSCGLGNFADSPSYDKNTKQATHPCPPFNICLNVCYTNRVLTSGYDPRWSVRHTLR